MFVFLFMAGHAIVWGIFVTGCCVTSLARDADVPPRECEARHAVIKFSDLPRFVTMALLALGSCLTLVLVVFFVTTETICRGIAKALQILVTGYTFDGSRQVCVSQRKPGAIMLKPAIGSLPILFGVAITAFLAQITHMFVVLSMAPVAILGGLFEHGALVAGFAFFFGMFAQQREGRSAMVKLGWLLPASFTVATAAILT
jgi:hypothetical protein